jgi:predicted TIM-barrel fold metal-dependent hydrolase
VSSSGLPGGIVDAWINVSEHGAPVEFWAEQYGAILEQFHRAREVLVRGEPREEIVALMDRLGIAKALITAFPVPGLDCFEGECAALAAVGEAYPGRFGVAPHLPVELGMAGARAVKAAKRDFGACAVRVMPARVALPPTDRLYYPVYTMCVEEALPITINVGLPGPALPAATQRPLELDTVCRDFPELVVVATHMGWPWHEELIGLMTRHPNLYAMTSAWAPKYYPREMVHFIRTRGRERVMFASDHPLVDVERCLTELLDLGFDDETLELFTRANAEKIFFPA